MNDYKIMRRKACLSIALACLALGVSAGNPDKQKQREERVDRFRTKQYGVLLGESQPMETLSVSASSVDGDKLTGINSANFTNSLFGQLPGLLVVKSAGSPGNDSPTLKIRGMQTTNDNGVLVLVDGFETKWQNLMVSEIENITVLKDASATALYGMRAANGVVLIQTKRGTQFETPTISFNARWGFQKPTFLPDLVNNGEYAELYNRAMMSDGKDISSGYFQNEKIVNYFKDGSQPYLYPDVDWYDEIVRKSVFAHEYDLSLQGGGRVVRYFVALGFRNDEGLYDHTDNSRQVNSNQRLTRYSVRSNVDIQINRWLSSEVKLRGTMEDKWSPNADETTLWKTMALFNPYPVRTPDGAWGGKEGYAENPVAAILQKGYKTVNERTVDASMKLKADLSTLVKGLSIYGQLHFSNNYWSYYNKTRNMAYTELTPDLDNIAADGTIPYTSTVKGDTEAAFAISQSSGRQWNRFSVHAGAEYARTFGKHDVNALLLYRQYKYNGDGKELFQGQQAIVGRVRYNYDKRYLAEVSVAYNGAENFPEGNRFGVFPAVSVGWVMSEEGFLKQCKAVDFLKVRASVGLVGNSLAGTAGRFLYHQYYGSSGSYIFGPDNAYTGVTGMGQLALANPDVTWEKAMKYNFGVDAMLAGRVSMSLEYFYEKRSDIAVDPAGYIPSLIGADLNYVNAGETSNQGFEASANYSDRFGEVGFNVGGRFSFSRSNVVDLKEVAQRWDYLYKKGHPIDQPFMLEAIGFFKDDADIASSPAQQFGDVKPGDIKYKDQNGDKIIDSNDRIPVGYSATPEIYYGLNLGLDYKGFDLSVYGYGSANTDVSMLTNSNFTPFVNGGVKPTAWVRDNYWTPERGDRARYPRLSTENNVNNSQASTLWKRNGAFFCIQNIELGYTFPKRWMSKARIRSLRVYVNVNDPFVFSKNDDLGWNPQLRNMFVYPSMRSTNFGVQLVF